MDYYRIATCVPQDCSVMAVTEVMHRTVKRCSASRTCCWLKLVGSEFFLSMNYLLNIFGCKYDAFENKYDAAWYQVTF